MKTFGGFKKHRSRFNVVKRNLRYFGCLVLLALRERNTSPILPIPNSPTAMESHGTTKRARVDEVETEQGWKRMVLKLLFMVCRITDMAIRLLMPKEKNKARPYSAAWPRGDSRGEGDQRCGESGKLLNDSVSERGSYTAVTNPELWVADHRGTVQSSDPLHPLHDSQTGVQLRKDTGAAHFHELNSAATSHGPKYSPTGKVGSSTGPGSPVTPTSQLEGTNYTREEEAPGQVHTLSHNQGGDQCLCDSGEVRDLRRGVKRGTSGFRDGVKPIYQDEQDEGKREGDQGEDSPHADQQQDDQGRDGGVRGVPEVPTMATTQTERGQEQLQQDGHGFWRMRSPGEEEAVLEGSTELTKQAKRALHHQAEAALRTAEDTWRELMS